MAETTFFDNGNRMAGDTVQIGGRDAIVPRVSGGAGGGGSGTSDATAANQTTQITRETEIRDRIGAVGDTAYASTDGSASGSLVALLKGAYVRLSAIATAITGTLVTRPVNLAPTAGVNLSGTVTTTSGGFNLPANANRRPGDVQGQNVGTNPIYINEFGGTAAAATAGSYLVDPKGTFAITTTNVVNFVAPAGNTPVTITGL